MSCIFPMCLSGLKMGAKFVIFGVAGVVVRRRRVGLDDVITAE